MRLIAMVIKRPTLQTLTNLLLREPYFKMLTVKAPYVLLHAASFMRGRYFGKNEITWGEHFFKNMDIQAYV